MKVQFVMPDETFFYYQTDTRPLVGDVVIRTGENYLVSIVQSTTFNTEVFRSEPTVVAFLNKWGE